MKKMLGLSLIVIAGFLAGCDGDDFYENSPIQFYTKWMGKHTGLVVVPSVSDDSCMRRQLYTFAYDIRAMKDDNKKALLGALDAAKLRYVSLKPTQDSGETLSNLEYTTANHTVHWYYPFDRNIYPEKLPKTELSLEDGVLTVTAKKITTRKDWFRNLQEEEICVEYREHHHGEREYCIEWDKRRMYDRVIDINYSDALATLKKSALKNHSEWNSEDSWACGQTIGIADVIELIRKNAAKDASAKAGDAARNLNKNITENGLAGFGAP